MRFLWSGIAVAAILAVAQQRAVRVLHVRSGQAELVQQGRVTILELARAACSNSRPPQRVRSGLPNQMALDSLANLFFALNQASNLPPFTMLGPTAQSAGPKLSQTREGPSLRFGNGGGSRKRLPERRKIFPHTLDRSCVDGLTDGCSRILL